MSTDQTGEPQNTNVEGQETVNLEQVQAQLAEMQANLEAEKASKDRILAESKKYKEGYQTFKAEKEEIAKMRAQAEEDKLREKGQYDVLLKQREEKLKELEDEMAGYKSEINSRDEAILNFRKAAAFEKQVGGKLKKDAYWNHVDFDKIAIDPATGDIDTHSLSSVVENFTSDFKELIDYGPIGNLPNGTATGSGKLTVDQWKALPLDERKKRMRDVSLK